MRNMSKYLEEFDKLKFEDIQSFYRKKKFLEISETLNGIKSVIEIGCGESSIFEYRQWQKNVLIEPIEEFSKRLSDRIGTQNIKISNCFLEDFCCTDTFDLVVVSCLLHEIPDKHTFMRAVLGLMGENSLLYLDVPNALSMHRYLAVSSGYLDDVFSLTQTSKKMQQSDTVFCTTSLCEFLNKYGLTMTNYGTNFVKFFHHSRMADLLTGGNLGTRELDALYDMQKYFPLNGSEIWAVARKINV